MPKYYKIRRGISSMIAIASDHGGYLLKETVKAHLKACSLETEDFGTYSAESCDYPDYGAAAAEAVSKGQCEKGIVICTTGIGMSIVANKIPGIRCALCADTCSAELTRRHNDSNMLALGAGIVGEKLAISIVDTWLDTAFEGGRHQRRIDKITALEQK